MGRTTVCMYNILYLAVKLRTKNIGWLKPRGLGTRNNMLCHDWQHFPGSSWFIAVAEHHAITGNKFPPFPNVNLRQHPSFSHLLRLKTLASSGMLPSYSCPLARSANSAFRVQLRATVSSYHPILPLERNPPSSCPWMT